MWKLDHGLAALQQMRGSIGPAGALGLVKPPAYCSCSFQTLGRIQLFPCMRTHRTREADPRRTGRQRAAHQQRPPRQRHREHEQHGQSNLSSTKGGVGARFPLANQTREVCIHRIFVTAGKQGMRAQ